MTVTETYVESRGHARIIYLGPVAPHWDVIGSDWGDRGALTNFSSRVLARLLLLTPRDEQFPRNKERCNRDAAREGITVEWEHTPLPEPRRPE